MRFLFAVLVGVALTMAVAHAFGDTPAPVPLDAAQADAHIANKHDLTDALDHSGDAHALLTDVLVDGFNADGLDAAAKSKRFVERLKLAEQAAPRDPLVWWIAAGECHGQADACAAAQRARAKLVEIDPDNAVTWLLEATAAQQAGDAAAAEHAFANAAAAPRYDDHMRAFVKMLVAQFLAHPHLAAIVTGTQDEDAYVRAVSIAATLMPPMQVSFGFCTPNHKPVHDAATVEECLKLATTMQHGDSVLAVSIGLRIEERLLEGKPEAVSAERRRRSLDWMLQNATRIGATMNGNSAAARQYRSNLYRSNSEVEGWTAMLTAQGIPLDPPADWHNPGHY